MLKASKPVSVGQVQRKAKGVLIQFKNKIIIQENLWNALEYPDRSQSQLVIDCRYNESAQKVSVIPSTRPTISYNQDELYAERRRFQTLFKHKQKLSSRKQQLESLRARLLTVKKRARKLKKESEGEAAVAELKSELEEIKRLRRQEE